MRVLKIIGITLAALIALFLITALFVNKDYAVKREVIVNKPKQEVYDYLKYMKNHDQFNVWAQRDPEMKKSFQGTDGTVGAVYSWSSESKEVGKGSQTIVNTLNGDRIDYDLHFIEPFEAHDHAYFSLQAVDAAQTKVIWGFDGKMAYPMNMMLLFCDMDAMLGKDLQQGLDNLKGVLEK